MTATREPSDSPYSDLTYDDEETSCPTPTTCNRDFECSPTPLPIFQLFIVIFIQISEPVTSTVIYPFVNDLIRSLGVTKGDEKKTGYYVGIVESVFYATEALTVLHWGRASDIIGRKPILLGGVFGLALAMLGFGLSQQYWMLIFNRCLQGAFNGNIGVMKSVMAEITDSTNVAQAFSFLPVAWSLGSTVGPLIGGAFADPASRWPSIFGQSDFFQTYPYFLPCLVAALLPISAFVLALIGLRETLPSKASSSRSIVKRLSVSTVGSAEEAPLLRDNSSTYETEYGTLSNSVHTRDSSGSTLLPKPSLRAVFVPSVLIPISNFAFLAYLDQSFLVLLPLIYSTPIKYGGLSLSPVTIGIVLGVWGVINGFVQVLVFPWLRTQVGHRNLYMGGLAGLGVCFSMFPFLNWLAKTENDGSDHLGLLAWTGVGIQLFFYMFSYMSYACMFMYISASAPSRFLLGTTNGLAQLTASGVRALAPTSSSSLFSLSLQLHARGGYAGTFGGYLVYFILVIISLASVRWSLKLPRGI